MIKNQRVTYHVRRRIVLISTVLTAAAMAGCGGGSGDSAVPPVADTTPPTITLNGEAQIVLPFAGAYREQGASAQDSVDGLVSVTVSGEVDTFNSGVYTVTYRAEDSSGNRAESTRIIEVLQRQVELVVSTVGSANYTLVSGEALDCAARIGECKATLAAGSTVTITASPDPNYRFVRWQNCDSVIGNECTIVLDDSRTILSTVVSTDPIVFQPGVVTLTPGQIGSLVDYAPTGNVLEFAVGADLTGIAVGNILLATRSSPSPVVFGRRVVEIETSSTGTVLVQTETPTIPEIIRSGTIVATSGAFTASASEGLETAFLRQRLFEPPQIASDSHQNDIEISLFGSSELVLIDDGIVRLAASGRVGMTPNFEFVYTLEDDGGFLPRPVEWRLYAETDFSASIETSISGPVVEALNQSRTFELPPSISFIAVSPIPILFEVRPVIDIGVSFEVAVEAGLEARLDRVVTGAQWHRGIGFRPLFDSGDGSIDPIGIESINGDLSLTVAPGLRATASVLGVAGPFVEANAVGGVTASFRPYDDCEVLISRYAAVRWAAGGRLRALLYDGEFAFTESEIGIRLDLPEIPVACSNQPTDSGDTEPPSQINSIDVVAADVPGQLIISWLEATDDSAIANYQVWRYRSVDPTRNPVMVFETAGTSANDIGLQGATEYCYFVTAVDVLGNASEVAPNEEFVCATTMQDEISFVLVSPTLLPAGARSATSIGLTWTSSGDSELISAYIVFDLTDTSVPRALVTTDELTAVVTGLTPDRTYCYAVASRDSRGRTSPLSNVECATAGAMPSFAGRWATLSTGNPGLPGDGILIEPRPGGGGSNQTWLLEEPFFMDPAADGFTISIYGEFRFDVGPQLRFVGPSIICGVSIPSRRVQAPAVNGVTGETWIFTRSQLEQWASEVAQRSPSACGSATADNAFLWQIDASGGPNLVDGVYLGRGIDDVPGPIGPDPQTEDPNWIAFVEGDPGVPGDGGIVAGVPQCASCLPRHTVAEELVLGPTATGITLSIYGSTATRFNEIVIGFSGAPSQCRFVFPSVGLPDAPTINNVPGKLYGFDRSSLGQLAAIVASASPTACGGISADAAYISSFILSGAPYELDGAYLARGFITVPNFFLHSPWRRCLYDGVSSTCP